MKGFFSEQEIPQGEGEGHLPQCGKCGLTKKCLSPKMKPTGRGKRKILFVAEAPGEQEDRRGVQLIGDAGQRLRKSLRQCEVDLDDCWKTNAVICRPPKNKIEPYMLTCCLPNLLRTINKLQPNVIVILGASALGGILRTHWKKDVGPLSKWVGWTIPDTKRKAWICPTYHPSYILRMGEDKTLVRIFEDHLQKAVNLENTPVDLPTKADYEAQIEVIKSESLAVKRLTDLAVKKGILAFDYEGTGLKPESKGQRVTSCSFCLNGKDTFAVKLTDKLKPLLSKILRSPLLGKVASNLKFEERWTKATLGHGVTNWVWDTMLAAHILDNRKGICSVKFQAFVRLGVGDYDSHISPFLYSKHPNDLNRVDEAPLHDLLLYNGLDSLLEYKVMEHQKAELKGEL